MEEVGMFILFGVLTVFLVIVAVRDLKKSEIEDKQREYELKQIGERLEYHKMMSDYQEDDTIYKIGEWDTEVRQDMRSIVKISDKYKPNKKVDILVGDYNKSSVSNTVSILESMGMDVKIAKSGVEIIKRIKNDEKYDLIITNNIYDRGHLDGPQTLKELKALDNFNTPVIVLTVTEGKRYLFVGELGFDEYMTKLLTQEKVLETIPKVIKDLNFTKIKKGNNL